MIKHGKIHEFYSKEGRIKSHLEPVKGFVTKGIADARESITIEPLRCDVKGAKRFNGQQCVIAKALTRVHKPQAVAVGRAYAWVVMKGLAVRFQVPAASRKLIEEFDQRGKASLAPIKLCAVHKSMRLGKRRDWKHEYEKNRGDRAKYKTRKSTKRYGVRAIGGGIA